MDKFILITNRYEYNNYSPFQDLRIPLYDNGRFDTESQAFVSFSESNYTVEDEKEFDLIFIGDTNNANIRNLIDKYSKHADNLFIILHTSSKYKVRHKSIIKSVLGEGFNNFVEQSHTKGDVYYEEIIKIAQSIKNNDKNSYQVALREIKNRFPDLTLEAKLELLHACLTPEGAKNIIDGGFPQILEKEKEKFWDKKLDELNPSLFNEGNNDEEKYAAYKDWTVCEVVKALSGDKTPDKKKEYIYFSDQDYLLALSTLRDCLLTNEE